MCKYDGFKEINVTGTYVYLRIEGRQSNNVHNCCY